MLQITFTPESDNSLFLQATKDYNNIWKDYGEKITTTLEIISTLHFLQSTIKVTIFDGIDHSHPTLCLSYDYIDKRMNLIHELGHILMSDNKIWVFEKEPTTRSELIHKNLYLFLYDVYTELYGKDFANFAVEVESKQRPLYKRAWNWALSFSKEERVKKFRELIEQSKHNG